MFSTCFSQHILHVSKHSTSRVLTYVQSNAKQKFLEDSTLFLPLLFPTLPLLCQVNCPFRGCDITTKPAELNRSWKFDVDVTYTFPIRCGFSPLSEVWYRVKRFSSLRIPLVELKRVYLLHQWINFLHYLPHSCRIPPFRDNRLKRQEYICDYALLGSIFVMWFLFSRESEVKVKAKIGFSR